MPDWEKTTKQESNDDSSEGARLPQAGLAVPFSVDVVGSSGWEDPLLSARRDR